MWELSRSLVAVWRTLRSMRTALILLVVVAVASMAGSLVPQAPNSPQNVASLFREHPLLARIYRVTGLFDVYGSWWFTLAYALLFISLVSCLVPRTRALLRAARQRPQPMRELEALRHFTEGRVPGSPEQALERARKVFRRRRYRVAPGDGGVVAAEKGAAREVGSLLFHWAFLLLLAGVVLGKGFGLSGQATVIEGETFTEAHASYDFPPSEGRFFGEDMHRGFQLRVRDFDVSYRRNAVPRDFVSRVDVVESGNVTRREEIRVNEPLHHEGVNVFQSGFGWAPVIELRSGGEILQRGPVVFVTDRQDQRLPWRGVVKLPSLAPQVGIELRLFPDPAAALFGGSMLEERDPFLAYTTYRGDLKLTSAQNVFRLDKSDLTKLDDGGIGLGESVELPGGVELSFTDLRQYTQFRITRDPGLWLVLASAILVLLGLVPALYAFRRKVWVQAIADGEDTRVRLGGFALQRKAVFEEEFAALARDLAGVDTLAARR